MNATAQENSGPDALANSDKNKVSFSLRCSTMEFALSRQVGVVINYHQALELPCQHRPQRNVVPILQRAQSDHRSFLYIHNRRDTHSQHRQLGCHQLLVAEQFPQLVADLLADLARC